MDFRKHCIGTQVIAMDICIPEKAAQIQNELSAIYNRSILPMLETEFNRSCGSDQFHFRLPSMELDVGILSYTNLENELLIKTREALLKQLTVNSFKNVKGFVNDKQAIKDFLLYYFAHGAYPWWISTASVKSINDVVWKFIRSDPVFADLFFKKNKWNSHSIIRLINHLEEETIVQLVICLEPSHGRSIVNYANDIMTVHAQKPFIMQSKKGFRKVVWEFILTYLLRSKGSHFHELNFTRNLLHHFSRRFNISYIQLLTMLADSLSYSKDTVTFNSSLPSLILELQKETEIKRNASERVEHKIEMNKISSVTCFLKYGYLPVNTPFLSKEMFFHYFIILAERRPDELKLIIKKNLVSKSKLRHILDNAPDEVAKVIITLLSPQHESQLIEFIFRIPSQHSSSVFSTSHAEEVEKTKSEFILTYLLFENKSHFTSYSFIKSLVKQISNHYHIESGKLLSYLLVIANEVNMHAATCLTLKDALLRLQHNNQKKEADRLPVSSSADSEKTGDKKVLPDNAVASDLNSIDYYLVNQKIPWRSPKPFTLDGIIYNVIRQSPDSIIRLLKRHWKNIRTRKYFFQSISSATLEIILYHLADKEATGIKILLQSLSSMKLPGDSNLDALKAHIMEIIANGFLNSYPHRLTTHQCLHIICKHPDMQRIFNEEFIETISKRIENKPVNRNLSNQVLIQHPSVYSTIQPANANDIENDFTQNSFTTEENIGEWSEVNLNNHYLVVSQWLKGITNSTIKNKDAPLSSLLYLLGDSTYKNRLLGSCTDDKLFILFKLLSDQKYDDIESYYNDLILLFSELQCNGPGFSNLKKQLFLYSIGITYTQIKQSASKGISLKEFIRQLIISMADFLSVRRQDLLTTLLKLSVQLHRETTSHMPKDLEAISREFKVLPLQVDNRYKISNTLPVQKKEIKKVKLKSTREVQEKAADFISEYYIENAGLILLAPYIVTFFSRLDLLHANQFKSESAAIHGVQLLNYLVTGDNTARDENYLLLNKLLCGFDADIPVELNGVTSPAEEETAEGMLKAVILNWTVIRNSSVETLRTSFLQRKGLLKLTDKGWQLTVEKKAYDVLLNYLPWNIKITKLPWMHQIIHTKWN